MKTRMAPDNDTLTLEALGKRIIRKAEIMKMDTKARGDGTTTGRLHDFDELIQLGKLVEKKGTKND